MLLGGGCLLSHHILTVQAQPPAIDAFDVSFFATTSQQLIHRKFTGSTIALKKVSISYACLTPSLMVGEPTRNRPHLIARPSWTLVCWVPWATSLAMNDRRRFPPPWFVEGNKLGCFIIRDAHGKALSENEPGRRKRMSKKGGTSCGRLFLHSRSRR